MDKIYISWKRTYSPFNEIVLSTTNIDCMNLNYILVISPETLELVINNINNLKDSIVKCTRNPPDTLFIKHSCNEVILHVEGKKYILDVDINSWTELYEEYLTKKLLEV